MSTYTDVQNARTAFVDAVGGESAGYIGNPLMESQLISFTEFLSTMASELTAAGGASAPVAVFDSQINDYTKMTTYLDKLIISNRDSQILSDADEFYFKESADVTQSFGTIHTGTTSNVILEASGEAERYIATTGITTSSGVIATYVTPVDYFNTTTMNIAAGVTYLELYAEKTSGAGELSLFIDIYRYLRSRSRRNNCSRRYNIYFRIRRGKKRFCC